MGQNVKRILASLGVLTVMFMGAVALTSARSSSAQTSGANTPSTMQNSTNTDNDNDNDAGHRGFMGQPTQGTASQISGNVITLQGSNGTTYTVDASNATIMKFSNNTKSTIQVSGIQSGDPLTVFGTVNGTNITAKHIIDGTLPKPQAPAASGTVSNISGNSFTVTSNNTTYTVDASQAQLGIMKPAGTSLANSGIQNGDTVTVFGTVNGNTITATRIMDGKLPAKFGMMGKMHGPRGFMMGGNANSTTTQQ